jgi:hypothetical protein
MRFTLVVTLALLGASDVVYAAPRAAKRPAAKAAAPVAAAAADEPSAAPVEGMMSPKAVKLRPMAPSEADANAVWSTRAALNIAALQCQFSPYLATVRNYNDFLRQHAEELDHARAIMIEHFKRYDGAQAQNSFDRYTTQTYNSFSTLDAQYAFCIAAGSAGRTALTIRKGELGKRAGALRDQIRAALVPVSAHALLQPVVLTPQALAAL